MTTRYVPSLLVLPSLVSTSNLTQAAAFNPPDNPDSAEQVERPNVAAIAAQDAVRRMGSNSTDEKEQETTSNGMDARVWRDQHSAGFERGTSRDHMERRQSNRDTRTTRDQMAFEADTLSRSGHGSMRGRDGQGAWV
jgi:aquaporin related protein